MKLRIVVTVYISSELHLDFTRQTLESLHTNHDFEVLLINNYCAPQYSHALHSLLTTHYSLIPNPKGNILAAAWNLGLHLAFDRQSGRSRRFLRSISGLPPEPRSQKAKASPEKPADYCLIINNDIVFHPQCIDHLVAFAEQHSDFLLWSASQWSNLRTLTSAPLTQSWSPHPHFSCFMINRRTFTTIGEFDEHFTMGYFEDNDYHTRILVTGGTAAATDSAKFYHYGSRTVAVDDDLAADAKYHYQLNRKYFAQKWGLDIHGRAFDPPEAILKYIKRPI